MKAQKQRSPLTQVDLQVIVQLRREKANLTSTLKEVEAALAQREHEVMEKLNDGMACRPGELFAVVEQKQVCNPSYKDELIAHFTQAHGIAPGLVEQQVRARWTKFKECLRIVHRTPVKSVH